MSRIKVTRQSNTLDISFNWRTPGSWFIALWAVIWNTFVFVFILSGGGIFILIHALVGIFVGYFALTRFFNKTRIKVDRQKLALTNGPMPWIFASDQDIPARSLVQLFVNKSSVKVNDKPTFNLVAKLDTGASVKLLKNETDQQLLLQLERTIETYLDIKNDSSFDLSPGGLKQLDLEEMRRGLEAMKPIKKWLPGSIVAKMEEAEAAVKAQELAMDTARPGAPPPSVSPTSPSSSPEPDWDVSVQLPQGTPRSFPDPEHDFVYPLYRATEGTLFTWNVDPYRIGRSAQIDWSDDDATISRQLEVRHNLTGELRYLYAELERGRWSYFEERRLDDTEVSGLGFTSAGHPHRFENGEERYYPRNEQAGTRFVGSSGEEVSQFIYFSTASTTQFRALRPENRGWEVYVMEAVDGSGFGRV